MLKSVASPQKEFDDGQISHSPPQRNEPNIFSLTNRYKNTKQAKPNLPLLDMNFCTQEQSKEDNSLNFFNSVKDDKFKSSEK